MTLDKLQRSSASHESVGCRLDSVGTACKLLVAPGSNQSSKPQGN